jgi:uncharacterized membrane protein YtjA (UPF0391 family)
MVINSSAVASSIVITAPHREPWTVAKTTSPKKVVWMTRIFCRLASIKVNDRTKKRTSAKLTFLDIPTISPKNQSTMLRLTLAFLVIAIIAAIFGFGGIAAGAAGIAKIIFYIFLVLLVISLLARLLRA